MIGDADRFDQDPADKQTYRVDFTYARRWEPNKVYAAGAKIRVGTGYQFSTVAGGVSGKRAPSWPEGSGKTLQDGSVTWVSEAVSTGSLVETLSTATWNVTGLTASGASVDGQEAVARLTGGVDGQTYQVRVHGVYSNGEERSAVFFVDVKRRQVVA